MKKHKGKILVLFLAVLLVSVMSCENPFLKKMLVEEEKGNTVPPIEGGASLILSPNKLDIQVKAVTSDGSAIAVEGCTETELTSGAETVLQATGTRVILKGKIIELSCRSNQLTALNVQGLTALKELVCWNNQLTALNVQGLTALQTLSCYYNQLTALNVQGCTALQELSCGVNQLTALNVQGLTALESLDCSDNQLTALDVQGLTALQRLDCSDNQLTALDMQGLTALKNLYCWENQLTALNVQGLTALKGLNCSGNQLTELNVQGLTALEELWCGWNQLTKLNVQGCTALEGLGCSSNRLNADAFKKLFDDLPVRQDSDDAKCVLYTEKTGVTEGNHTDFTAPQDLKDAFDNAKIVKKWKMYKRNGSGFSVEI